jgi:signal transduction histidine kinase
MSDHPAGRLLVVDDETPLMNALRQTLRDEGYRVVGATSGDEALAALRRGGFDLVLTDLLMPKMDGIALLRAALATDPLLAGIVMTGHGSIPTAVAAMQAGAIDYVLKPVKLSTLLPVIERALTIRRLRQENVALERRVHERTAELEAANRELDAFCDTVSHDLRTPLRAVAGFTDLMRLHHAAKLPADVRRYLDLIHEGTGQMDQLIKDLLAFSRLGRQALARGPVDLAALGREAFAAIEGERAGRRVEFEVGALPAVSADRALLRLVLVNLLSNAVKYSRPRDPARIALGLAPAAGAGAGEPVFFVRDNGVGFDMRDAGRLFGVFQRLHHAHEFEGTGVGLATVRRIVERHGGKIWAEAVPGAGATFFFTLPPAGV